MDIQKRVYTATRTEVIMNKARIAQLMVLAASVALTPHAVSQQSSPEGLQGKLMSLFSAPEEDELLEPDLAFKLSVTAKGTDTLLADLVPARGYYLYKERIQFSVKNGNGVDLKEVKFPAGEMKTDQIFGRTEVYKKAVPVEIALDKAMKGKSITLVASYQGCHEKLGVCYPPIEKTVNLVLP
jgi:thiol:disulfide interchange protein